MCCVVNLGFFIAIANQLLQTRTAFNPAAASTPPSTEWICWNLLNAKGVLMTLQCKVLRYEVYLRYPPRAIGRQSCGKLLKILVYRSITWTREAELSLAPAGEANAAVKARLADLEQTGAKRDGRIRAFHDAAAVKGTRIRNSTAGVELQNERMQGLIGVQAGC